MRPMGELEPRAVPSERVKCWKCATWFMMASTASRGSCPECGSEVALHRLKMPTMPSSGGKEVIRDEVIRLPVEGGESQPGRLRPQTGRRLEMSALENAEKRGRNLHGGFPKFRPEDGKVERHQMFEEADPRREGEGRGLEFPQGITLKTLLLSVGVATFLLLILILAIES